MAVDLSFLNKNMCTEIKNTYVFTYYDKDWNVVNEETYHNVTMPKRYFAYDISNMDIRMGVMLPRDFLKYQVNGVWKDGWAAKTSPSGGAITNTGSEKGKAKASDKTWKFYPRVEEGDTSLLGTCALALQPSWECTGTISSTKVELYGKATAEYHSPYNALNSLMESGSSDGIIKNDPTDKVEYYDGHGNKVKEGQSLKGKNTTLAMSFVDCGLFGNNGIMLSHFLCISDKKRPFEYFTVSVTAVFTIIPSIGGTGFSLYHPKGNLMYAHKIGGYSGTCQLRPGYSFSFSGLPVKSSGNGCMPIPGMGYPPFQVVASAETDTPNDWNEEKKGTWFGLPHYQWLGKGNVYKTKKVKEKYKKPDGTIVTEMVERNVLNDKKQRQFTFGKLKEETICGYGRAGCTPVRSFIVDDVAAIDASRVLKKTDSVNYIKIGVGDGHTTRFYHSITPEVGVINRAYCSPSGVDCTVKKISYYENDKGFFSGGFVGAYDGDFERIISANQANRILDEGYDKTRKACYVALQPFTLDYYSHYNLSGLMGAREWLVYAKTGTIRSAWIGMNENTYYDSRAILVTSTTISGLKDNIMDMAIVPSGIGQHDCTQLNFECKGYVAVKGTFMWHLNGGYAGGMGYSCYDTTMLRFSDEEICPGYVEFASPPVQGANVYIDVNFNMPFFGPFTKLEGKMYHVYGSEQDNGEKRKAKS